MAETYVPHDQLLSLEGRVAVVTGGASGIGAAIVRRFVGAGATCVVADPAAGRARWDDVPAASERILPVEIDVRDDEAVVALGARAVELGGPDVWVNNAGIFPRLDPLRPDREASTAVLDLNVRALEHAMQVAAGHMTTAGRGVILNVASTAAFRGAGTYSASKWAVRGLTAGLAPVVGPHGVRVVGVAPTLTATEGLDAYTGSDDAGATLVADVSARIPLRRLGSPDDVARAALFLVSDAAGFVTGHTLVVDGGSLQAM